MGLFKMSSSTYDAPIVGRVTFSPLGSAAEREALRQRDRVFERVNAAQLATARIRTAPNPDPMHFHVLTVEAIGANLVAIVQYPDCPSFEGKKVLVFAFADEDTLRAQVCLDPHFAEKAPATALVPVARFEPTMRGLRLARICAAAL